MVSDQQSKRFHRSRSRCEEGGEYREGTGKVRNFDEGGEVSQSDEGGDVVGGIQEADVESECRTVGEEREGGDESV